MRPFLYNVSWSWQFRFIDEQVKRLDNISQRATQTSMQRFLVSQAEHDMESGKESKPLDQTTLTDVPRDNARNFQVKIERIDDPSDSYGLGCKRKRAAKEIGIESTSMNGVSSGSVPQAQVSSKRRLKEMEMSSNPSIKAVTSDKENDTLSV